jgi:hypothetical protein
VDDIEEKWQKEVRFCLYYVTTDRNVVVAVREKNTKRYLDFF